MELHHRDTALIKFLHERKGKSAGDESLSDARRPLENECFLSAQPCENHVELKLRHEKFFECVDFCERCNIGRFAAMAPLIHVRVSFAGILLQSSARSRSVRLRRGKLRIY